MARQPNREAAQSCPPDLAMTGRNRGSDTLDGLASAWSISTFVVLPLNHRPWSKIV